MSGALSPDYDPVYNTAVFRYTLLVSDKSAGVRRRRIEHPLNQVYWSPYVLREALSMAGFGSIKIFKAYTTDEKFGRNDYTLHFAATTG